MQHVILAEKSLADYAAIVGDEVIAELEQLARPLKGARIAHVSSASYGSGVAETLHALVPLMKCVGLDVQWHTLSGDVEFYKATRALHHTLQGMDVELTPATFARYLRTNVDNAACLGDTFDYVVVHDPQPAPLRMLCPTNSGVWIWRCHIDLTAASARCWSFLRPFIQRYDAAVFTSPTYVKPDLRIGKIAIIPPAIDPMSPKNMPMSEQEVADVVTLHGVDPQRPTLTQVSRFDPWKDPLGVIGVYRAVKGVYPDVQLVLIGSIADDDPEGMGYYQYIKDFASNDPDIHLFSNVDGLGCVAVNAFQRQASVILQKSLREGFGLAVSEGLWKAKPVIGSNVGGIPLQILDGITGYLVESVEQCSARVLELLAHPERARMFGERGHTFVADNFLLTTHLRNYLKLFAELDLPGATDGQHSNLAHDSVA